jgi:hypothetical protein
MYFNFRAFFQASSLTAPTEVSLILLGPFGGGGGVAFS